ncbi:glutamate--tRNA ligase [candidate division KSB1 bacterium]
MKRYNEMNDEVRVRFAPSPTGSLHVGNARTAILNWLCARHSGGKFILRIEDTDLERSTLESEQSIYNDLRWLGLDWNEGPDKESGFGPYRQSERKEIYQNEINKLIENGNAYYCFCSKEELEAERKKALAEKRHPGYSGKCRDLKEDEIDKFRKEGKNPVLRFRVPDKPVVLKDIVQGEIRFEGENLTDFVILRENGSTTYNFSAVVDDSFMKITHVIRGNDHVSNTPKQILLYEALGYNVPEFAHIPMITGMDGVRLSKRHGHTSVEEFKNEGYLPEALINFLSLLSWSSESGEEILSVDRLIKEFDLSRISKSQAAFDHVKMNWMNGLYIRSMDKQKCIQIADTEYKRAGMVEKDHDRLEKIVEIARNYVEKTTDFPKVSTIFFKGDFQITGDDEKQVINNEDSQKVYVSLLGQLKDLDELTIENFQMAMKAVQNETGLKGKELWIPVRVALTGLMQGPELPKVLEILGIERCADLLRAVIK